MKDLKMTAKNFIIFSAMLSGEYTPDGRDSYWCSCGGGTWNVAAGEISRACGCSYEDAHGALDWAGRKYYGPDWKYGFWPQMTDDEYLYDVTDIVEMALAASDDITIAPKVDVMAEVAHDRAYQAWKRNRMNWEAAGRLRDHWCQMHGYRGGPTPYDAAEARLDKEGWAHWSILQGWGDINEKPEIDWGVWDIPERRPFFDRHHR